MRFPPGDEWRAGVLRHGHLRAGRAGWVSPSAEALANGAAAITPGAMDWLGLLLICFVLPGVLCWAFGLLFRKAGWINEGDLTLS